MSTGMCPLSARNPSNRNPTLARLLAFALLVATAQPGRAGPLWEPVPNLAPQHLVFLQPVSGPVPAGSLSYWVQVSGNYATVYSLEPGTRRSLLLDMEIARLSLRGAARLREGLEAGLELPFLWMGNGVFDPALIAYHDLVRLPGGGREDAPRNTWRYRIVTDRGVYAPDPPGGMAPGDAVAFGRFRIARGPDLEAEARLAVKLPTGDPARGTGSGHPDLAAGAAALLDLGFLDVGISADAVWLGGSPDPALELGRRWGGAASAGAFFPAPWGLGRLSARVRYRTNPYRTGLDLLDRDVLMFVGELAGTFRGVSWSLGFTEDLAVHASPDFSVFLRLAWAPSSFSTPSR